MLDDLDMTLLYLIKRVAEKEHVVWHWKDWHECIHLYLSGFYLEQKNQLYLYLHYIFQYTK